MTHMKQTYSNILVLRSLSVWRLLLQGTFFFDAFAKLRKATVSFVMSVLRPCVWNNSAPAIVKIYMGEFYLSRSGKAQFGYNRTKVTDTLHKDLRTFIYGTTLVKSVNKTELIWLL